MLPFHRWQSHTALAITVGLSVQSLIPFALSASATAAPAPQTVAQFPQEPAPQFAVRIPAGTVLPTTYDKADKVVVLPTETTPLTLTIARNIRSSSGRLLIPAGSQLEGELRPAQEGSQFVAKTLVLTSGRRIAIDASSNVITKKETVDRGTDWGSVLKGAAIGGGAATVISAITGNRRITLGKVLIGAGAGALGGVLLGRRRADVIVIDPKTDLDVTLNSALTIDWQ